MKAKKNIIELRKKVENYKGYTDFHSSEKHQNNIKTLMGLGCVKTYIKELKRNLWNWRVGNNKNIMKISREALIMYYESCSYNTKIELIDRACKHSANYTIKIID